MNKLQTIKMTNIIKLVIIIVTSRILLSIKADPKCVFFYDLYMNRTRLEKLIPIYKIIGKAELSGYQLDFTMYSKVHHGSLPTLTRNTNKKRTVWGVVYEIDSPNIYSLDEKKGVFLGINRKENKMLDIKPNATVANSKSRLCTIYYSSVLRKGRSIDLYELSKEQAPAPKLIEELRELARNYGFPTKYLSELDKVPHNGDYRAELQFPNPKLKGKSNNLTDDGNHRYFYLFTAWYTMKNYVMRV